MATMQVPGYRPENADQLHKGCWAEQGNRVLMLNDLRDGKVAYETRFRDGQFLGDGEMKVLEFQRSFSDAGWLWHDKTPVPLAA